MLPTKTYLHFSSAINSTSRYYVSMATKIEERTSHIALLSLFQTLGFIVGPGIQVETVYALTLPQKVMSC